MTTTVTMTRMQFEVAKSGFYEWVEGYLVRNPETGRDIYPPVTRAEAYKLARELAGQDCKVEIQG